MQETAIQAALTATEASLQMQNNVLTAGVLILLAIAIAAVAIYIIITKYFL